MKALVAIVGSTATGKSSLAIKLAKLFDGEIVNADSRQMYRYMDIGTGKPTVGERKKVPHHLFDIVDPNEDFNVAYFLMNANSTIKKIHNQGRVPILVGGTGQYMWALLEGWEIPAVPPDPQLRDLLEREAQNHGVAALYATLARIDPGSLGSIHPNNLRRIIRALEVYYQTGTTFSETKWKSMPPYNSLILGLSLERKRLYSSIDRRVDLMLQKGWVQEVEYLLHLGYSSEDGALSSLGYRELISHIRGYSTLEQTTHLIKSATHRFARNQETWFRLGDPRICWLDADETLYGNASVLVRSFLSAGLNPCATMNT